MRSKINNSTYVKQPSTFTDKSGYNCCLVNGRFITKIFCSVECPIALAAGIHIFVKRQKVNKAFIIVRMMSELNTALAPMSWQYGGINGPAPPVLVARKDGIPFSCDDYWILDEFSCRMFDDGPREVTRKDFMDFAKEKTLCANLILFCRSDRANNWLEKVSH